MTNFLILYKSHDGAMHSGGYEIHDQIIQTLSKHSQTSEKVEDTLLSKGQGVEAGGRSSKKGEAVDTRKQNITQSSDKSHL